MLLAEALALRADQQKKLKEIGARIDHNARVPEGQQADEDPNALLEAAVEVAGALATLIERINRTNAATAAAPDDEATISDLIARRDHAQRMTQLYRGAAKAGTRDGSGRGLIRSGRRRAHGGRRRRAGPPAGRGRVGGPLPRDRRPAPAAQLGDGDRGVSRTGRGEE